MFEDRGDAGRRLARWLGHLRDVDDVVVLGVARGGVPVAAEVADALGAPLDFIVVRRLTAVRRPGITAAAVAEGGTLVRVGSAGGDLSGGDLSGGGGVERLARRLRQGRAPLPLAGRTAVLVDDGMVTGASARAACAAARRRGARRLVLAVPVVPAGAVSGLYGWAEEVIRVVTPPQPAPLSAFYAEFPPVSDQQVIDALHRTPADAAG